MFFESPIYQFHFTARRTSETRCGTLYQFFFTGIVCRASMKPLCFSDGNRRSCSLPSGSKPPQADGMLPKTSEANWEKLPTEERHRASTYSLSIQQSTRSLPNVILPPPLQRPSYSTCAPPRKSPCDVSFVQRDKLEFEKCPTPATYNHCQ